MIKEIKIAGLGGLDIGGQEEGGVRGKDAQVSVLGGATAEESKFRWLGEENEEFSLWPAQLEGPPGGLFRRQWIHGLSPHSGQGWEMKLVSKTLMHFVMSETWKGQGAEENLDPKNSRARGLTQSLVLNFTVPDEQAGVEVFQMQPFGLQIP